MSFIKKDLIIPVSQQEVSYSELLVPSRSFFCKPRRQQSEHIELGDPTERCMHPGVARCFSYEPATHKATAHYIPHSPHGHYDKGTVGMSLYIFVLRI